MGEVNREERREKVADEQVAVTKRSSPLAYADRGFGAIERWLSYFGTICLIGLMAMVVIEVVSRQRWLFRQPIHGYIDIMEMMMAVLVFLTLAYCQREGGHIRMEIFMTRVLKGGRRYHAAEFFHQFISLVGFGIIAFFMVKETQHAYAINDLSLTIYLPTWPPKLLAAIGAIFLCFRFILQMFHSAAVIVGVERTNHKEELP